MSQPMQKLKYSLFSLIRELGPEGDGDGDDDDDGDGRISGRGTGQEGDTRRDNISRKGTPSL